MLKRYIVRVNGKSYEVEVEEINDRQEGLQFTKVQTEKSVSYPQDRVKVENQDQKVEIEKIATKQSEEQSKEEIVRAPMSGTIVKLKVNVGDKLKDGQTILTLEAMKMENEILAPFDCNVKEILVKEGQQVEIDQPLVKVY